MWARPPHSVIPSGIHSVIISALSAGSSPTDGADARHHTYSPCCLHTSRTSPAPILPSNTRPPPPTHAHRYSAAPPEEVHHNAQLIKSWAESMEKSPVRFHTGVIEV